MWVFFGGNQHNSFSMESKCDKKDHLYMPVPLQIKYEVDENCYGP